MAYLIDKSALVAEIENRIDRCNTKKWSCPANTQVEAICDIKICAYKEILSFLYTTEVKNVDFDALGVLSNHLLACNAHGITPKYSDRELDFLEGLVGNKARKGE